MEIKKSTYYTVFVSLLLLSFLLIGLFMNTTGISMVYYPDFPSETQLLLRRIKGHRTTQRLSNPCPDASNTTRCKPNGNVIFIKTYKTGSTTLRNILNRYGLANNLSFILNRAQPVGHVFKSLKSFPISELLPPIGVRDGDYRHYKYNMSNVHMRPSLEDLHNLTNPNSVYITILRHPVDQWLSYFQYFHKDDAMRNLLGGNDTNLDPVRTFLNLPAKFMKFKSNARNYQFRDLLEVDTQREDVDYVREKIDKFAELFDLVLLTEYFDESLVLLKRLLGWSFDDVLYLKMREQPQRLRADDEARKQLLEHNRADNMLYSYFYEVLQANIAAYGPSFHDDLNYFRNHLNRTLSECVGASKVVDVAGNHQNIRYDIRQQSSPFCKTFVSYGSSGAVFRRQSNQSGNTGR